MRGKLILVVGPSGVGKDTLIDGARAALAGDHRFHFAKRVITRPAEAGGEDHESVSQAEFEQRLAAGRFLAHWRANGLSYGAPSEIADHLAAGRNVVLNASRRAVGEIAAQEPELDVIHVDAPADVLDARLRARGRESAGEIARRRARIGFEPPEGVNVAAVLNDGTVEQGVARFLAALLGAARLPLRVRRAALDVWREPFCLIHRASRVVAAGSLEDAAMIEIAAEDRAIRARLALVGDAALAAPEEAALSEFAFDRLGVAEGAEVEITRSPSPKSRAALRHKVGGGKLLGEELRLIVRDLVEGRYSPAETAGFLVAASTNLDFEEIVALTRLRAEMMEPIDWGREMVLDKHSIGGVPGGRITLIIAPIIAAHGAGGEIIFPKTSSRAITSAAGTADAMEAAAKVDLGRAEMREAVERAGACILWNGRINHSPLDDVMNAINRPLGVSSRLLDVSSILSKKLVAGATHALVDIPVGEGAKIRTFETGQSLARLFEDVGQGVGLTIRAVVSRGEAPIGRGIGPALELRDVLMVLKNSPEAPQDLREKALDYAGRLLDWDPAISREGGPGRGKARAEELLASGAAAEAFERICAAQGKAPRPAEPGVYAAEIRAPRAGVLRRYDGFALAGLARAAGAPSDKGAGIDLLIRPGERAKEGEPLFRLHASQDAALSRAMAEGIAETLFEIAD